MTSPPLSPSSALGPTLRPLPLPTPSSATSVGSNRSAAGGWDATVADRFSFDAAAALSADARRSCSVSQRAISHGCSVVGIRRSCGGDNGSDDDDDNDRKGGGSSSSSGRFDHDEEWVAWEATFDHRVCRVASNADGTVVVASTAGGTVSLLRGSDGRVLATRRVYAVGDDEDEEEDEPSSMLPAEIAFVSGGEHYSNSGGDILAILVPPREASAASSSECDEFGNRITAASSGSSGNSSEVPYINIILVSGIDGTRLNSPDPAEMAAAASKMSIDALNLTISPAAAPSPASHMDENRIIADEGAEDSHVVSLGGCFIGDRTVRFLALDGAGGLSAHDYDTKSKEASPVSPASTSAVADLDASLGHGDERWKVDESVGICVDSTHSLFLISATQNSSAKICYYGASTLALQAEYILAADRPRLYAVAPISSCASDVAAAAIAFKSTASDANGCIVVIQTVIGGDGDGDPCVVFKVPIVPQLEQEIRWIDVSLADTGDDSTSKDARHYSFHYKVSYNSGIGECMTFCGDAADVVGRFRRYLAKGSYDEADALLASAGASSATKGKYGTIHGSEVALQRFKHIIDGGDVTSAENMTEAKECLRRLSSGAVTGGDRGVKCLLDASSALLGWPSVMLSVNPEEHILTRDYRIAISAMSATVAGAMKATPPAHLPSLRAEKLRLDSKLLAIRCVEHAAGEGQVQVDPMLADAASPADVFRSLVLEGSWVAAEKIRRSEFAQSITPEHMASALVGLPATVDPRSYCSWLEKAIIPGLSINHPILAAIRYWTCRVADAFDDDSEDNELGLDSAITLLKTVADATANLATSTHTTFLSGFSAGSGEAADASRSLNDTSCSSLNTSVSYYQDKNQKMKALFCKPPPPSVMQLGVLRGGAPRQRGTASFMARRVQRGSGTNNASTSTPSSTNVQCFHNSSASDAQTVKLYRQFEDKDVDAEAVEVKLDQAISLQRARDAGLPKRVVTLRLYNERGGSSFIAKELVRIISSKASSNADRKAQIMERVQPFCEAANTDFNVVLSMYTKELCDSNRNNARVLLEASSLSRLCTGSARCEVALKVLRAAILCTEQPPALSDLSREAIEWAIDDGMRSELEEATRLLVVDRIVRRYCGNGAQELFRVADPRHGLRLLHFVCRHIDGSSTIQDALALCDAFTHLSKADACVLILRRMALSSPPEANADDKAFRADQCASLLRYLYTKDPVLAEEVGVETCMYLSEAMQDCSPMMGEASSMTKQLKQKDGKAAARAAISILSVMQDNASKLGRVHKADAFKAMLSGGTSSWSALLQKFQSIYELQSNFSIYLSPSDLESETIQDEVCRLLLRPAVDLLDGDEANADEDLSVRRSALKESLSCARRGVSLLFAANDQNASKLWCKAVGNQATYLAMNSRDDSASVAFLVASGLLDELSTDAAFDTIYSVATAHCIRASKEASSQASDMLRRGDTVSVEAEDEGVSQKSVLLAMRCIVRASSVLEDHALRFCPWRLLGPLVSLTGLADTISQVLTRGDGGSGEAMVTFRAQLDRQTSKRRETIPDPARSDRFSAEESSGQGGGTLPITPPIHSNWYVGDGLLLPPLESLQLCMVYCKKFMALIRSNDGCDVDDSRIYDFLNDRGAHTIALRLRASVSAIELVSNDDISPFDVDNSMLSDADFSNESKFLVERSLGGSGSGITSGSIDSELALAYLLTLPIKTAFRVYRACLPSAISKRDFARVATLATIGVRAGDGSSNVLRGSDIGEVVAWKKQDIFVDQCRRLSSNARWWGVLQTFGVAFDPRRFDGKKKPEVNAYVASLVLPLIVGASKTLLIVSAALDQVLALTTRFVTSYGLDQKLAAQKHVEFLLSLPEGYAQDNNTKQRPSSSPGLYDVRSDLRVCERAAKDTLLLLPSSMARAAILRRCLISLEAEEECFKDYERYSFIVSLYLSELALVLADKSNKSDFAAFQREYECIDKRQDALLILLSYFQDRTMQERPPFPKMFTPLPTPFKSDAGKPAVMYCGILGQNSATSSPDAFDPIQPLVPTLSADGGASSVAALSPLCFSLGLPAGYIHARSLYLRINKAMSIGATPPPFDSSVRPIINRIKGSRDAAEISEWCALKYPDGSKDRLECLELALSHAMRASSEAEQQARAHKGVDSYAKRERLALDAVKRIGEMKSALSDRIKVENILSEGYSPALGVSSHVRSILSGLVDQVKEKHTGSDLLTPEEFVERILLEASSMTSEAVVSATYFTMDDFRQVAVSVHKAISGLADCHSHVDVGGIARRMARRWLVHGNTASATSKEDETSKKTAGSSSDKQDDQKSAPSTPTRTIISTESDDTEDFVMNLNDLGADGDVWSDDVGSTNAASSSSSSGNGVIVADEEPSALTIDGCAREEMELSNTIVSLRIAFVMSYAEGYHKKQTNADGDSAGQTASSGNRSRATRRTPLTSAKLNRTFSSKASKSGSSGGGGSKGDAVLNHARELLGIAFAKKSTGDGGSDGGMPLLSEMSPSMCNASMSMSIEGSKEMVSQGGKVHSFAMRYRALRVASMLCPQEALDLVIRSEGYGGEQAVDLEKCAFASFLAMEAEAMGLAIPSSDLVHLSTMSFSSYARALWRNHGHDAKGRLLLLLVELCLREASNTKQNGVDGAFLVSLISELSQKQLPRSLLSSLELVASSKSAANGIASLDNGDDAFHGAVQRTAMLILRDLKGSQKGKTATGNTSSITESTEQRSDESINTISRLCSVVDALCPQDLPKLVQMMCGYVAIGEEARITKEMTKLAAQTAASLEGGETRSNAFSEIIRCGGKHHLERNNNVGVMDNAALVHEKAYQRDLDAAAAASIET